MSDAYRVTIPDSLPDSLELAGELVICCDGTSRDVMTLEAYYVIPLGPMYDARCDGNSYYDCAFDKEARTLTYTLTPYGIVASLAFGEFATVSNALVDALIAVQRNHLRNLTHGDFSPTQVRQGLDHALGTELIAHLAVLGVIGKMS